MFRFRKIFSPLLLVSLMLGLFIRGYQYKERFMYAHDNDLASWMVKDIVFDRHWRLIGQLTSSPGIFIGPLFYYLLIPFYLLSNWDPIGTVWFSIIIGGLAITSIYYVFYRLYGKLPAGIAGLLYAVSWGVARTEREVVPTTPVFLWCIWFFYSIHLLFRGEKKGLIYALILAALVWHINLALGLLIPLVAVAVFLHKEKYSLRDFIVPFITGGVVFLPLALFEFRHHFSQTRALFSIIFQTGSVPVSFFDKIIHVIQYAAHNATWIFYWDAQFSVYIIPGILLATFIFLFQTKKYYEKYSPLLYSFWILIPILFFTFNSINLSEYYLNSISIVWLNFAVLFLSYLFTRKVIGKIIVSAVLSFFIYQNFFTFITFPNNASGYLQRTALVKYIATDAKSHNFPCVAVSYMTSPGNNFGYRYLFYRENLHVNQPNSLSPVYTIVFPQSLADRLDISFGSIGLILPDYARYNPAGISQSCSGANANLTDPMFGFTN